MPATPRRAFNGAVTQFWGWAAPAYNQPLLQQWVYRPAHDEVIAVLKGHGCRRVVDVACGTGILADRIQRELHPDAVYGVDMSDGMLAQARERSAAVEWRKGPAEKLPFDDGAVDAVVTTSAFHWFDQPAALRDFHRVLAPGGVVAVTTMSPRQPILLSRLVDSTRSPAHNPAPGEMRALFTNAGFLVVDQHRVGRPWWTQVVSDLLTVGTKAP